MIRQQFSLQPTLQTIIINNSMLHGGLCTAFYDIILVSMLFAVLSVLKLKIGDVEFLSNLVYKSHVSHNQVEHFFMNFGRKCANLHG